MIGVLCIYGLAADISARRVETLVTAICISIYNVATQASILLGGSLYSGYFNNALTPLLLLSGSTTAACALLVKFLPAYSPESKLSFKLRNAAQYGEISASQLKYETTKAQR